MNTIYHSLKSSHLHAFTMLWTHTRLKPLNTRTRGWVACRLPGSTASLHLPREPSNGHCWLSTSYCVSVIVSEVGLLTGDGSEGHLSVVLQENVIAAERPVCDSKSVREVWGETFMQNYTRKQWLDTKSKWRWHMYSTFKVYTSWLFPHVTAWI